MHENDDLDKAIDRLLSGPRIDAKDLAKGLSHTPVESLRDESCLPKELADELVKMSISRSRSKFAFDAGIRVVQICPIEAISLFLVNDLQDDSSSLNISSHFELVLVHFTCDIEDTIQR